MPERIASEPKLGPGLIPDKTTSGSKGHKRFLATFTQSTGVPFKLKILSEYFLCFKGVRKVIALLNPLLFWSGPIKKISCFLLSSLYKAFMPGWSKPSSFVRIIFIGFKI